MTKFSHILGVLTFFEKNKIHFYTIMLGEKYPWGRRPRMDPDGPATAPTAPDAGI